MDILYREQLIKNPSIINNHRYNALLTLLNSLEIKDSKIFMKEDLYLITYDIWMLLELGDNYKQAINESNVQKKQWRLFFLDFIVANRFISLQLHQQFCTEKNFYLALFVVKKIAEDYTELLSKLWGVQEKFDHNSQPNVNLDMSSESLQLKIFQQIQRDWNYHLYDYEQVFKKVLSDVMKNIAAVEKTLGEDVWQKIEERYFFELMISMEYNQFLEITFWKQKLEKNNFLQHPVNKDGSTVICVQQDASMQKYTNIQSAVVLAISKAMQQHNQNVILLPFSQIIQQETIALNGTLSIKNFFDLNMNININDRPIHYKNALNYAFFMLKLELSITEYGKIYLLCNEKIFELLPEDDEWKTAVSYYKQEQQIKIKVIYLGDKQKMRPIWFADSIIHFDELISISNG